MATSLDIEALTIIEEDLNPPQQIRQITNPLMWCLGSKGLYLGYKGLY